MLFSKKELKWINLFRSLPLWAIVRSFVNLKSNLALLSIKCYKLKKVFPPNKARTGPWSAAWFLILLFLLEWGKKNTYFLVFNNSERVVDRVMFGIVNGYENFTSYKDNSKTWMVCINITYEWRLRGLDVSKAFCVKLYVDYKVKLIVNWLYQWFFFNFH